MKQQYIGEYIFKFVFCMKFLTGLKVLPLKKYTSHLYLQKIK